MFAKLGRLLESCNVMFLDLKAGSAFATAAFIRLSAFRSGALCIGDRLEDLEGAKKKFPDLGPTRYAIVVGFEDRSPEWLLEFARHLKGEDIVPIGFFADGEGEKFRTAFAAADYPLASWVPIPSGASSLTNSLLKQIEVEKLDGKDNAAKALLKAFAAEGCSIYPQLELFVRGGFAQSVQYAAHNLARNRFNPQGVNGSDPEEAMIARVGQMIADGEELAIGKSKALFVRETEEVLRWSPKSGYDCAHLGGYSVRAGIPVVLMRTTAPPIRRSKSLTLPENPLRRFGYGGSVMTTDTENLDRLSVPCWKIFTSIMHPDYKRIGYKIILAFQKFGIEVEAPEYSFEGQRIDGDPTLELLLQALKDADL